MRPISRVVCCEAAGGRWCSVGCALATMAQSIDAKSKVRVEASGGLGPLLDLVIVRRDELNLSLVYSSGWLFIAMGDDFLRSSSSFVAEPSVAGLCGGISMIESSSDSGTPSRNDPVSSPWWEWEWTPYATLRPL